jgi:glutathione peroxidase
VAIYSLPVRAISGADTTLRELSAPVILIVNVASRCGLTPQYAGLQQLHERYADRGFAVAAFPCNQFGGQEPGDSREIQEFCTTAYGVTFPLFEKIDVRGPHKHPLYAELTRTPDRGGKAGPVRWNFEKFLVSSPGDVLARFRSDTTPDAAELVGAVAAALAS